MIAKRRHIHATGSLCLQIENLSSIWSQQPCYHMREQGSLQAVEFIASIGPMYRGNMSD